MSCLKQIGALVLVMVSYWMPAASANLEGCRMLGGAPRGWLYAECPTLRGRPKLSMINPATCPRGVINQNGNLMCLGGPYGYERLPYGNYKDTCKACTFVDDTLSCSCLKIDGEEDFTMYHEPRSCGRQIQNINGQLRCR